MLPQSTGKGAHLKDAFFLGAWIDSHFTYSCFCHITAAAVTCRHIHGCSILREMQSVTFDPLSQKCCPIKKRSEQWLVLALLASKLAQGWIICSATCRVGSGKGEVATFPKCPSLLVWSPVGRLTYTKCASSCWFGPP